MCDQVQAGVFIMISMIWVSVVGEGSGGVGMIDT